MASTMPSSMRASQFTTATGGLEKNLQVNSNAALPKGANSLSKHQTLVRVNYAALNPVDYKVPEMPVVGYMAITKPASPSMDFSGKVVSTQRSDLKPGQWVFGKTEPPQFGALAEYCIIGQEGCVPLPEGVSPKEAACVGVAGLTAYQCIAPYVKQGDKVFINGGSGGTGTFGIQFAKALGCHVTTTCSGPNVDLCKSLGADEIIDYRTQNAVQSLIRSGTQYDLVFDTVGADFGLYWHAHHYLKPAKSYVCIGATPSLYTVRSILSVFLWPSILGGGQRKFIFHTAATKASDYKAIGDLMEQGKVKAVIEEEYSLEDAGKAFARLKSGRVRGKLVVNVANG